MEGKENTENNLRKAARVVKNILKSPFKRRILLIAIAIAAVIILCGAAYESLVDAFSNNVSDYVQGNSVQYSTDDNSIVISDETIDGLIRVIEDMGIDLDDMELTRDDIAKLYAAEVVSSEINRGVTEEAGKYYGRVYIKRLNPDTGELEMLNYEPSLETFEQMDASQILNYYSMDGDKICIANTNTSTDAEGNTTSTVTINKLSYKDNISQYTVPIEFLLDLCLISQNPGFVLALADKIINETEIVIQVLQNKTTVQTDTTYTYTTETETSTKKMEYDAEGNYISSSITTADPTTSGPTSTTTTQTQINVNSSIKVQSVKNWIMEVVYTYNKVDTTNTQEPTPEELEDETKPTHQYTFSEKETNNDGSYTNIYTSTVSRKIDQTKSYKITTTSETYQSGVSEGVKDRVDEFIEMLRTPYSIPSSRIKEAAVDNLENGAEMLFQMLQNGQRTQSLEQLMRYILGKATGNDYGVSEFDFNVFDIRNFNNIGAGGVSPFGTNISREEFINAVQTYSSGSSYSRLASAAGDFYDVCLEYDVNPCLAFAWACVETGYGSSIPGNNLFGYAVYNGASGGATYSTYADSIRDFCEWVVNGATEGTSTYNSSYARGQEFATVNSHFAGTPASNIYVLFSIYMYLGDTHIADEPDFSNPAGTDYYASHGSTWGAGGRIQIYSMYELGGLYTGEYAERCGHPNGSDPTTLTEKADYAQYCVDMRKKIAETIFGNGVFLGSGEGSISIDGYEFKTYTSSNGKTYTWYLQNYGPWIGQISSGGSTFAAAGCYATSVSTIASGYGSTAYPSWGRTLNEFQLTSRYLQGSGSGPSGAGVTLNSAQIQEIQNWLYGGGEVMIHVVGARYGGASYYTSAQHWMPLVDISEDGQQVYIMNTCKGYSEDKYGWNDINRLFQYVNCYHLISGLR